MKIRLATLVKRVSQDGFFEIQDHVQLGQTYAVDLDSICVKPGYNLPACKWFEAEVIKVYHDDQGKEFAGYFATELLEFQRD